MTDSLAVIDVSDKAAPTIVASVASTTLMDEGLRGLRGVYLLQKVVFLGALQSSEMDDCA